MRKRKQILSLLLSAGMVLSIFAGCGSEDSTKDNEKVNENTEAADEKNTASDENKTGETVMVDLVWFNDYTQGDGWRNWSGTDVHQYMVEQIGVDVNLIGLADDQVGTRIASGELGDLLTITADYRSEYEAMIESEMLLPIDELVDQYAPEIRDNDLERWQNFMDLFAAEDGHLYMLPVNTGNAAKTNDDFWRNLYKVRWDLYKELNYPEITNEDDLIAVLKDMQELHPETEDGKKVYGASFYLEDSSYQGMVGQFEGPYHVINRKGAFVYQDTLTNELYYDMTDVENSLYWRAVDYYFRANQAGILDPDSLTQTRSDYESREAAGEHFSTIYWTGRNSNEDASGYISLPVEGTSIYDGGYYPQGWSYGYAKCVPADCKNPEAVMKLLSWWMSEEGSLAIYRGIEGVHWNYNEEGVPVWIEEYVKIRSGKSDAENLTGILDSLLVSCPGYREGYTGYDGYPLDLSYTAEYLGTLEWSATAQEINEHYGTSYPTQIVQEAVEEGKMTNLDTWDSFRQVPSSTEDIDRIDAICVRVCLEAVPKLVFAENRDEFEAVKAETLEKLEASGANDAASFYKEQWALAENN